MISLDAIDKYLESPKIGFVGIFIVGLIIMGLLYIGSSLFLKKGTSDSRLSSVYFGGFLLLIAAFLGAFKEYMPW